MANILVVDDRPTNREFLVTLLGYQQHRLLEASDGAEALAMVRAHHPDLVITDILMPTMDGYEFVRQLRSDPDIAATTVVFYTAHYHKHEADAIAKSCGVRHILTKPCEPDVILRIVEESLATPKRAAEFPAPEEFDRQHLRIVTDKLSETVDDLHISNQRMAVLVDINLQLASERDPKQMLKKVCDAARELIAAKHALLAVGNRDNGHDVHFVSSGMDAATAAKVVLPVLRSGAIGVAYAERSTLRLTNPLGDPQSVGLPAGHPPAHALLVAPIVSLAHVYGWICLSDKIGATEFSTEDERLLGILAAQVGRIYENGSLYAEVRKHAVQLEAEIEQRKQIQEALGDSELRFRQMAENIRDVFFLNDMDTNKTLYVSPCYEEIWGRSRESLYANPDSWSEAIHPDDRASVLEKWQQGKQTGSFECEYRIVRPDQSTRWLKEREFPVRDDAGKVVRFAGIVEDITVQKLAEIKIERSNRLYAVLSGINNLIVRTQGRDALFREACQIAVGKGKFPIAWIGVMDGGQLSVPLAGWAGNHDDYRNEIETLARKVVVADSAFGAVVSAAKVVMYNDIATEPGIRSREVSLASGIRSMAVLPLCVSGKVVALFTLCAEQVGYFDEVEMELLRELADDISFALDHLQKAERLDYLAYYDALTGLANRRLFHERVAQHMRSATNDGHRLALFLFDLERFKNINDTLGQPAGDDLLKQVASWLEHNVGDASMLARVEADHFAVVLPEVAADSDVASFIESIMGALREQPFRLEDAVFRIAAKAGVALFPEDGDTADALFKHAEAALKQAKAHGDRYLFYTKAMTDSVANKPGLESQLRQALENEEFVLHYQPKVDLGSNNVVGAEALIRWNDPRTGLVPPFKFIPILEETGLIYEVGRWAMRRAIADYLRWRNAGLPAPRIAVNVSPLQLRHRGFIAEVEHVISIDSHAAAGLELEITEGMVMEDIKHSIASLQSIRGLGVSVAIDDFGTGFSSLGYLSKLPIDTLKIDRSFVIEMTAGPEGLSLVSTIVTLAHSLKLKVVAEGVETDEQQRLLRLLSCDEMQGYLFSKPIAAAEFEAKFLTPSAAAT